MSDPKYRTPIPENNPSHAERPDFPPPEDDTHAIVGNEAAGRELEKFKRNKEADMRVLGSAIDLGQEIERTKQRSKLSSGNQMQNKRGEWVPSIPLPFYGLKKKCSCDKSFWKAKNYEAHYALEHIVLGELPL